MKKMLSVIMACVMAAPLMACTTGKKVEVSSSETTVDVKLYKAGYGTVWLEEAAKKFEETYKDSGYKINIVEASNSVPTNVLNEVQNIKTNGVDLYFTNGLDISTYIKRSASILKSNEKTLIENLNDVYSSKPIKFDGTLESNTIEEKMFTANKPYYKFQGTGSDKYTQFEGNYYTFPWASGPAGLYINKSVLDGFSLGYARTTDELLEQYAVICPKNSQNEPVPAKTGVYPFTYPGQDSAGYWLYTYETLYAQYVGVEKENNFWKMQPETGTMKDSGYKVYDDEGLLKALQAIEKITNDDYCVNGTNQLSITNSQRQLLDGKAAYISVGNWVYNEMKQNYADKVDNITMIKMPILSALGEKLGITDATLRSIVSAIDNGDADAKIATDCSTTEAVAARVREARNVYFNASVDHQAIIPSYSPSKEVAKLFLRFLASDDNLDLYKSSTNSSLPFNYETSSNIEANNFMKSTDAVSSGNDKQFVAENYQASPLRQIGVHCFAAYNSYPTVFLGLSQKIMTAQEVYNENKSFIADNWSTYLRQAGLN